MQITLEINFELCYNLSVSIIETTRIHVLWITEWVPEGWLKSKTSFKLGELLLSFFYFLFKLNNQTKDMLKAIHIILLFRLLVYFDQFRGNEVM